MTQQVWPPVAGQRIAIAGAGISGLVCAHLLAESHEVTVFEAAGYLGGHTNTINVNVAGVEQSVDTGFIVYNDSYYPGFKKLLERLKVASQRTTMSLSLRCDAEGLEYSGASLNALFAQRRNLLRPGFWRMLADVLRFQRSGLAQLPALPDETTVGAFVQNEGYSAEFVRYFLAPMGSALWSAPVGQFLEFPIRFVIEFFANHGMMQVLGRPDWRVIRGGSQRYVEALVSRTAARFRTSTPVRSVARSADRVRVNGEPFDHVIFACHSDQALAILGAEATAVEREVLGHFPYQCNEAVLHTDTRFLPRRRRAWACWNYRLAPELERSAAVTYNMNLLQSLRSPETFCVSLNEESIEPAKVIKRITYHHPVFRPGRRVMQARQTELIGPNRTSFCGAYWGFGFHEDGVRSALAVCRHFGKELD